MRTHTGLAGMAEYGVHNNSYNNLMRGITERVLHLRVGDQLVQAHKPLDGAWKSMRGFRSQLLRHLSPTTVVDVGDYPNLYTGRKQRTYERAVQSLAVRAIERKDSYVNTFVKAEKINFTTKGDPAPRVIQPRHPRYNVMIGRYLKNFEGRLCRGFSSWQGYKVITKGLNADSVAAVLRGNWEHYSDPIAISIDASRFDQHVSRDALEWEHSVYNSVFNSPELAQLLKWQLENKGFGRAGDKLIRYCVDGCRMSGDINTGMGNCLIMSSIVLKYFTDAGLDARLTNNGDDCVIICERGSYARMHGFAEHCSSLGFKIVVDGLTDVFERILFCQTQPVWVGKAYRMVRQPNPCIAKDLTSLLPWDSEQSYANWLATIGSCGAVLTSGVPVLEAFYAMLLRSADGGRVVEEVTGMQTMSRGVCEARVSDYGRFSFYCAFGITPDQQICIEDELLCMTLHHENKSTIEQLNNILSTIPICHLLSEAKPPASLPLVAGGLTNPDRD